jgi:hypothetical protein
MKDLAIVTDRLRRAVAEVEDRIHPEETHLARLEPDQIDADAWTTESGLHAIAAWFKSGNLVPFAPPAAAPANAAVSQQRTAPAPTVAALSILISLIRRGRGALLALSFRVKAAAALKTLTAKPKSPVVGDSTSGRSNDDHPFKARLDAFGESLLATTRRAVEVNGIVSRPAETLVGALAELEPRREGRRRNYQKSLVPDGFINQLVVAMEVAGQDFALILGDHFEIFWRTEILPVIEEDLGKAGASRSDFSASAMRRTSPTAAAIEADGAPAALRPAADQLREQIHKACDDFAIRMRAGGVSALAIAMPRPVNWIDIFKSAVRYPMQFVFLLTYIVLPIVAIYGLTSGSAPAVLKGLIPFVLPLLLVFAIVQARSIRRAAAEAALDGARRQLRAEAQKTAHEIGDAISASWSSFLSAVEKRVENEIVGAADAVRDAEAQQQEAHRELGRTAIESRLKGLAQLQKQLQTSLDDAAAAVTETLDALAQAREAKRLAETTKREEARRARETERQAEMVRRSQARETRTAKPNPAQQTNPPDPAQATGSQS